MRRALAFLVIGVALSATPTVRAADENRECGNNEDVTVVVDFGDLGGGVNVRCAPQGADGIKSGFDALEHANITYEQSGGYLCRIAGKPESGPCNNRPGAGPYWAYYYAKRGEPWKYSSYGAGTRKPPPGSAEGWAYADADGHASPPDYPVPAPIVEPTPTTAAAEPVTTTTRARSSGGTATTTTHTVIETTTTEAVLALPEGPATTTSMKLGNVDLSVKHGGGGTSVGFLASAAVVVGLAGAAALFLRQRAR